MKPAHMTQEQLVLLNHVVNLAGKRIIPCMLFSYNTAEMIRWQFNCCKQTSILVNALVKELLIHWGLYDQYDVQSWEGIFLPKNSTKSYNHAWVYVKHLGDGSGVRTRKYNVLIDVARVEHDIPVLVGVSNKPIEHLVDFIGDSIPTKELSRQQLDYWEHIQQEEYFTHQKGAQLYQQIRLILSRYSDYFDGILRQGILTPMPALLTTEN